MIKNVPTVRPRQTLEECLSLMSEGRARHLPVLDEQDTILGIVSFRDVAGDIMSEREFTLEQLENYIVGRPS